MGIEPVTRKFVPRSSSDQEYDPRTGVCSVDFFMASKDLFRIAPADKIPMVWPYHLSRASDGAEELAESVRSEYERVLAGCGITLRDAKVRCLSPRNYNRPRDTLIINTHDEDSETWKGAATLIQDILDEAIRKRRSTLKIRVEIRNDIRMYRDVSYIIEPNSLAHKACMQVEQTVYEKVKEFCPDQWRAISYHMRGPAFETENRKPTIMIRIASGTRSFWQFVMDKITGAVKSANRYNIELHIEILPGCAQLLIPREMMPPEPFIFRDLPENPVNGSSIGARGTQDAGSLGTWVDFQPPGNEEKQRCFLTCHHVISSGDEANKTANNHLGIGLDGRAVMTPIIVDYPAPFDAAATMEQLHWEIAQGDHENGQSAQTINNISKHISTGGIGSVIHASGYFRQNINGHRMDWALVRVHRSSPSQCNTPPAANFSFRELSNGKLKYKVNAGEVISKSASLVEGEWAAKVGRSGVTAGEVNSMQSTVHWGSGAESKEIEIAALQLNTDFAQPGDSGAMVINLKKEWVGILIGKLNLENYGFVTSTQELMDDIRAKTGGSISLV